MGKSYFSKQAKCERKNYAPCHVDKEQLEEYLQLQAQEIIAFAKDVLGENYPAHFEVPKISLLPVNKTQTFGKYAYNMVLQEEAKLQDVSENDKSALLEKLAQMRANVKIERPLRGSFFADGGIVIYYCNICELCEKEKLDFEGYITSVLAHEIFHALHFAACDSSKGWQQVNYWNGAGFEAGKMNTVRESLAEYFRYLWLAEQQSKDLLVIMLKELLEPFANIPNYPYAGVRYLLPTEGLAKEKFTAVFKSSLQNWHEAYELLIS